MSPKWSNNISSTMGRLMEKVVCMLYLRNAVLPVFIQLFFEFSIGRMGFSNFSIL